jgi:hypothetical protein
MILIPNPVHKSQLDNRLDPFITCNTTSLAMVAESNGVTYDFADFVLVAQAMGIASSLTDEAPQFEDLLTQICNSEAGILFAKAQGINTVAYQGKLNQWYSMMAWAMNRYLTITSQPFTATFHAGMGTAAHSASYDAAEQAIGEINAGRAVLIGTNLAALAGGGGHIVALVGYEPQSAWIINDPYGNPNTNYYDRSPEAGKCQSRSMADPLMTFTFMVFIQPKS